jgi:hypothetical protein
MERTMLLPEFAPLVLERVMVGSIVVVTAAGVIGLTVGQMQSRWHISNTAAWLFFIVAFLATVALSGFFQVAERLAPHLQPYIGFVALISVIVNAAIWTSCSYTLFSGKRSRS